MFLVWLFIGGAVGLLNTLILWWAVARLRPDAPLCVVSWGIGGALLRWCLIAGLIFAALQVGIGSALLAFVGLWLVRWGAVCWLNHIARTPEVG